jgi:opacity protein-like surface antigen
MKKLAIILTLLIVALPSFGQTSTPSQWSIGVGVEGGLPTGDFNNYSSFGIGGLAFVGYNGFDPSFQLTLTSGYLNFSGKDYTIGDHTWNTKLGIIPILLGGKYYFMPGDTRVYGQANVGLYLLNASASTTISGVSVSGSTNSSKFGVSPILGAQFKAGDKMWVDAHVNYTSVFTDNITTSWIGFGVGLVFDLQ